MTIIKEGGPTAILRIEKIAVSQRTLVSEVTADEIAAGTSFPLEEIIDNLPSGFLLVDVGCGLGDKTIEIAKLADEAEIKGQVVGVDRNPNALGLFSQRIGDEEMAIHTFWMDATSLKFAPETVDVFTAFGLFCNLIGPDAKKGVDQLNRALKPGGLVYLADCLSFEEPSLFLHFLTIFSMDEFYEARTKWNGRYEENERLGLPRGTFLVFCMGHKDKEYDDAERLRMHWQNPEVFERYARHWEVQELFGLFGQGGFGLEWFEPQIFRSRTNEFLLGVNAVFQKK